MDELSDLTVIKLGGALLTDKERPGHLRHGLLAAIAAEVRHCRDAGLLSRLILVHGVGSFGHPPVLAHRLHKGFQDEGQLLALAETQQIVMTLRQAVAEAFRAAGAPVCLMLPSSCMTAENFALATHFWDGVAGFVALGMIPLLGGDILADAASGFSVYSGDKLAVDLALHFGAERLIFATAVDAIYDRDPNQHEGARPLVRVSLSDVSAELDARRAVDASGAMAGKLAAIRRGETAVAAGMRVDLISMMQPNNLRRLLQGEKDIGTRIVS
jgi:isopentenyl phosphate kinase